MSKYGTQDIRNIAFVGHADSGKTTLADALLHKAKATPRPGSVEDGTSVFDFEPEEKEKRHSIDLAVASANHKGREFNLLDTPGYADFAGEAICALNAVETAVICVSAVTGVKVNTRKMWERAKAAGVARAVMITKLDADNASFAKVLGDIQAALGRECVPVLLPSGSGVVNLVEKFDAVPAELRDVAKSAIETLLEGDDALMEEYLATEKFSAAAIAKALPKEIAAGKVVPVLCSTAKRDAGIAEFLDFAAACFPSPADVPVRKSDVALQAKPDGILAAQVFKSVADPFVHKLSFLRVYSGTLTIDHHPVYNQRTGKAHRAGGMFKPFGKEARACASAIAGDIVCVTKVDELNASDTVCAPEHAVRFERYAFPVSMASLSAEPKTKQDLARMSESIHKMADSDPTFHYVRDPATHELVISGLSGLHLDTIIHRLRRKFDVQMATHPPKIALKETVVGHAEGHHKHKKQSGGHGQYAEVYLRLKPSARGEGFKFTNAVAGGAIPVQYIAPIEKGIRETLEKGVIAGYPVVDVEAEVYDGSYHDVDSGPEAFKLAGSKAFKEAFRHAKPVLLEPIVNIEIEVPTQHMGHITGDLNTRRGRIQGMEARGDHQIIRAQVPMKEIGTYSTDLHSATGGEGSYTIEFSHYDPMPAPLADKVIAAHTPHDKEE